MGIVKDLKALFNKSYLGTRESDEILLDLKELSNYYITYKDKNVYLFHKDTQLMKNVLRIERR